MTINTNDAWTATVGQPSWMHISKVSGKGDIEVTLTAEDNASSESRTDTSVFKSDNTSSTYRIVTTQAGRYLDVNVAKLMFLNVGGTQQVVVSTDGTYEVKVAEGNWMKVSKDGDVVTIETESNETGEDRTGKIVVSLTDLKSGSLSLEIEVLQRAESGIVLQPFGPDQQWELNTSWAVTVKVTGFGTDKSWDSTTGTQGNLSGETFGEDKKWD